MSKEVLILGGSSEGHALARAMPDAFAMLPAPMRNDPGDVTYRMEPQWTASGVLEHTNGPVVLATHPCDEVFRTELPVICAQQNRPLLHLMRPPWSPQEADRWHMLRSDEDVAAVIPVGATVFVGIGRAVENLETHLQGRTLVIRQLGRPSDAKGYDYAGQGRFLNTEAPVTVAQEIETLQREQIDWLLLRNAGGSGSWPKLEAARTLGLPVAMLPRPAPMPDVAIAPDVRAAMDWLKNKGLSL